MSNQYKGGERESAESETHRYLLEGRPLFRISQHPREKGGERRERERREKGERERREGERKR